MTLSIDEALRQGVAAHKDGKVQEAERLYRSILEQEPKHADANHNLGKGSPRVIPAPLRKVRRSKCQDLDAIVLFFYFLFENVSLETISSINSGTE